MESLKKTIREYRGLTIFCIVLAFLLFSPLIGYAVYLNGGSMPDTGFTFAVMSLFIIGLTLAIATSINCLFFFLFLRERE